MRRVGKSVITLALAAEEQLPETELPHVWSIVKEKKPAASRLFNETRNWLKHNDDDEKKDEHYIANSRPMSHWCEPCPNTMLPTVKRPMRWAAS